MMEMKSISELSYVKKGLVLFIVISILLSFTIVSQVNVLVATNLTVNTSTVIQSNFLGVNGVFNGNTYMNCQTAYGMTSSLRDILNNRIGGIGLSIARTEYHTWWACRNNWNYTYDWNSHEMTAFYNWCQDMKDRNIDIALTMPYYFPAECYNWGDGGGGPTDPKSLDKVAKWVSASVNQLINVKGFTNIKYILVGTEPNTTPHNEVGGPPSGYTNF